MTIRKGAFLARGGFVRTQRTPPGYGPVGFEKLRAHLERNPNECNVASKVAMCQSVHEVASYDIDNSRTVSKLSFCMVFASLPAFIPKYMCVLHMYVYVQLFEPNTGTYNFVQNGPFLKSCHILYVPLVEKYPCSLIRKLLAWWDYCHCR